jgi:hypothetical protein
MSTYTESQKIWQTNWRKTIKGKASTMWTSIGRRLKTEPAYKNIKCSITRNDFLKWVIPQLIYWVNSGNPLNGSDGASLDRINNKGNYQLDNLQIISQRENNKKHGMNYDLVNEKYCTRCKLKFSRDNFFKDKTRADGLSYSCKECRAKDKIRLKWVAR